LNLFPFARQSVFVWWASNNAYPIHISSFNFNSEAQLDMIQDNWLFNLSNMQIRHQINLLLQLERNFGLPLTHKVKEKTVINFIKHIEKNLTKNLYVISEPIRNHSIPIINRLLLQET